MSCSRTQRSDAGESRTWDRLGVKLPVVCRTCQGCVFRAIDALFCSLTQLKIVSHANFRLESDAVCQNCDCELPKIKLMFSYGILNAMKHFL